MNCKVMLPIHAFMHHERAGLDRCTFAGLEDHRTDGQLRRSAPLHDFDIWLLFEPQRAIACVGDLDGKGFVDT